MSERQSYGRFLWIIGLGFLASVAFPAFAQEEAGPWSPGKVVEHQISALDAIQMTLDHAPFIRLQEQSAVVQEGFVLQAAGQFDAYFLGDVGYEYTQTELTTKEKEAEQKRRDDLQERIEVAQQGEADAQTALDETTVARNAWTDPNGDPSSVSFSDPLAQAQYLVLLEMYNGSDANQQPAIEQAMINFFDAIVVDSEAGVADAQAFIAEKQDVFNRLGEVPEIMQSSDANLNLSLSKQYRNGIIISPRMDMTGTSVRYKDKGYLTDDGGLEIPDAYTTTLGFDVVFPLARNRGKKATGAFERAAEIDYEASLDAFAFSASSSALETLVAYWDLVAAQKSLEIQLGSLEVNQKILQLTQALIDADELPRAELPRTEAAVAQDEAAVNAASRAVIEARIRLATAIGLEVGDGGLAPLASDTFPAIPRESHVAVLDPEGLFAIALEERMDLKSARKLEESGKVLVEAARINLRPVTDLDVGVAYNNLGENNNAWDGISDSFTGTWAGPSARLGVSVEVPIKNNLQKGLLKQQRASLNSAGITADNLERTIALGIARDTGSIEQVVRQTVNYGKAAEAYREAVRIEMERLQYGTVTVLDTLITQQRAQVAELALVDAQARYSRLLAQLAFDTGTLVAHQDGRGSVNPTSFTNLPVR
jgi:outer membrane protein TolC